MWALVTLSCVAGAQCQPITAEIFKSLELCNQAQAPADGWHGEAAYCVLVLPPVRKGAPQ